MDKSRLQRAKLRSTRQTVNMGNKGPGSLEIILVLFLLLGSLITYNSQTEKKKNYPPEKHDFLIAPEKQVSDLHYMFKALADINPDINTYITKQEVQLLKDKAEASFVQEEPRTVFYKRVAPVVTRLGDKNSRIQIPVEEREAYIAQDAPLFPLDIKFNGEETTIYHNYTNDTLLAAGTPVIAINGIPVQQIESTLLDYISGRDTEEKKEILRKNFRELQWYVFRMESPYEVTVRITIPRPRRRTPIERVVARTVLGLTGSQLAEMIKSDPVEDPYTANYREEDNTAILACAELSNVELLQQKLNDIEGLLAGEEARGLVVDLRGTRGYDLECAKILGEYIGAGNIIKQEEVTVSTRMRREYALKLPWYQRWYPPIFNEDCKVIWDLKKGEKAVFPSKEDTLRVPTVFEGLVSVIIDHNTGELGSMIAAAANETGAATTVGETTGSNPFILTEPLGFSLPETALWVESSSKKVVGYGDSMMNVPPSVEVMQDNRDTRYGRDTVLEMAVEIVTARDS